MFIKKNTIIQTADRLKHFVMDIKTVQEREVALLYGAKDAVYRFAVEDMSEKGKVNLKYINDPYKRAIVAKAFDIQNGLTK